jgi:hydrogenase-4 membrane subunit HyfE
MIVNLVVLIAGAVLLMSGRTAQVLVAYIVLAIIASVLVAPLASSSPVALTLFIVASMLKLILTPLAIVLFLRANPTADDLRPSINMPTRLLLVVAFAILSGALARIPSLAGISALPLLEVIGYVVLCGIGMLIVHRSLLAHMIGLLALGIAIALAGVVFAPKLPEFIELGAAFDALLVTFIGLVLVRSILAHNPLLDVESLRRLRG